MYMYTDVTSRFIVIRFLYAMDSRLEWKSILRTKKNEE